mmetsp:Transcript_22042/g.63580  ORF Transcript_22042/g.63580 Transcript_22042/m.63580 type:complete len:242 (+) Transcript_22042:1436-2161(+)
MVHAEAITVEVAEALGVGRAVVHDPPRRPLRSPLAVRVVVEVVRPPVRVSLVVRGASGGHALHEEDHAVEEPQEAAGALEPEHPHKFGHRCRRQRCGAASCRGRGVVELRDVVEGQDLVFPVVVAEHVPCCPRGRPRAVRRVHPCMEDAVLVVVQVVRPGRARLVTVDDPSRGAIDTGHAVQVVVDKIVARNCLVVRRTRGRVACPLEHHAIEEIEVGARAVESEHLPLRARARRQEAEER